MFERIKDSIETASKFLGIIAILFGGLFGLQQYLDKQNGERVKETLNFLDRYQKESFTTARADIDAAWVKNDSDYRNFFRRAENGKFDNQGFNSFIIDMVKKEGLAPSFSRMLEFYEALDVCNEKKICDAETSNLLFKSGAMEFFNAFFPYIHAKRCVNNNLGYALGLQHFAGRSSMKPQSCPGGDDVKR